VDHDPTQLQFPFALWTLPLIRELIRREFQVRLSEVSVGRLLKKLGLSPQKPLRRAYEQNPAAVQTWRDTVYPARREPARRENAVIYFGDEAGVRSDFHAGTTWAPKGRTPIVRATGKRFALNRISAVSAQGGMRFMTVKGCVTADVFIEFLRRLLHGAKRPVYLIVDGHPAHRAAKGRRFVEGTQGRLRLYLLAHPTSAYLL